MNKTFSEIKRGTFFYYLALKYKKVSDITGINIKNGCREFKPDTKVFSLVNYDKVNGDVIPARAKTVRGRTID